MYEGESGVAEPEISVRPFIHVRSLLIRCFNLHKTHKDNKTVYLSRYLSVVTRYVCSRLRLVLVTQKRKRRCGVSMTGRMVITV